MRAQLSVKVTGLRRRSLTGTSQSACSLAKVAGSMQSGNWTQRGARRPKHNSGSRYLVIKTRWCVNEHRRRENKKKKSTPLACLYLTKGKQLPVEFSVRRILRVCDTKDASVAILFVYQGTSVSVVIHGIN